jgi:hypothetical protein
MTPAALRGLLALAGARRDRDLARLEALAAEDRGLAEEILRLAAIPAQDMADGTAPLAQQALRYAWVEQQIARARRRRAALAREIAAVRAEAAASVGKHAALEKLESTAARPATLEGWARAPRDAPSG